MPIISSARRAGARQVSSPSTTPGTIGHNEIDNHADTICAGPNWRLLELTGEYCTVAPFSSDYAPKQDIPIAKCATTYTCPTSGASLILVADQVLWFGNDLHCSLINPHQLRAHGHGVCDDPWDPHRELGIDLDHFFIPLHSLGPNLVFESRVPTDWEMEHLDIVELTSNTWNPVDMHLLTPAATQTPRRSVHTTITSPASHRTLSESGTMLSTISCALDPRRISSLYVQAITVYAAPTGTVSGIGATFSSERHSSITAENLSRKWNIGIDTAKKTLQVTTQRGIRTAVHPLHRRYRVDHLHLNRRRLNGNWFTDTLFSKVVSIQGNVCAQVFTNGQFTTVHPMDSKSKVAHALTEFADDVGIPDSLLSDGAPEMVGPKTEFMKEVHRLKIRLRRSEVGRSNQNYAAERNRRNPDISEWLDFEFYDRVWFYDHKKIEIDGSGRRLARWLGVAHRVGSDLCYWLLLDTGKIIARTTVQHVVREDYVNDETRLQIEHFDRDIEERLSDRDFVIHETNDFYIQDELADVVDAPQPDVDYDDMTTPAPMEADDINDEIMDKYLNAELIFDVGTGTERKGRVVKRAKGTSGEPIGRAHANPLFDTREYVVEFTDGSTENYFANVIAECMYAQVDSEGRQFQLLQEITDHRSDNSAIPVADGFVMSRNGNRVPKVTTRGWSLLVSWKDGSSDWIPLKDIKDSYPVQIAEYAVTNNIAHEPAFNWWVPTVLRKRHRIVAKVKRYWRTTHKFGIRLPKTVEEALAIDDESGTDFWRKALSKEMGKVKVAWKPIDNVSPAQARSGQVPSLIGFQEIRCHIIFDIKMDFTRKARFVAGGHTTDTPGSLTYSSVVSRDSVRLAFLIAGLNDLDVLAGDVTNAYLNAKCRKDMVRRGIETGEDQGQIPTWIRSAGTQHYDMILVYVDDILIFAKDPKVTMNDLGKLYELKPESVKEPDIYLGANMEKVQLPNGKVEWSMGSKTYVKNAIKVVEALLLEDDPTATLKSTARNPFPSGYKPELDVTPELNDELASRFLQLVGILRWAIELGRIDIFVELSQLSQHQALPRKGHLEAIYHIFAYLKKHENGARIVFDPKTPTIDERVFNSDADWSDFYGDVCEEMPPNMPEPKGKSVSISCFVDANHAGNAITRRSHTGIIIYVQNAPILWFSKRQNTVESSSFGSEFVALRTAKDMIVALRYKLRMFGVPIDGPANVFCDNNGVVKNTTIPESMLAKKHNAINYHVIREAVAAKILRVGKEDGMTNLADLFTKVLTADRRRALCRHIMY
ncbi:Reverse transcriptase (RNA-dependent DNA polymerase) [Fragilaria crotonensis]|nr:Reverse transcriptase (RNA-dependent DNA polymerase) [Fragilaria crotonensis]